MSDEGREAANGGAALRLREAVAALRAAGAPEARATAVRALLEFASAHASEEIDVPLLAEAAGAILEAWNGAAEEEREALRETAHLFLDLARRKTVRLAACPAEPGHPGGEWLDAVIRLIEATDFTVGRMFRQRAAQHPTRTLFVVPRGDVVTEHSWDEVQRRTRNIARGLLALVADDPRVAVYTPNHLEGALCDLACLTNGIFDVPVPANATHSQLEHILSGSGIRILIVSGGEGLQNAFRALERIPTLEWVITLDPMPAVPGARVMTLERLVEEGRSVPPETLEARVARVRSADVATAMYTSGTTGVPKGIQFSHLNLVSKRYARAAALPTMDRGEVFLCFLPLYHTFGRYLEMLACVHLAATYIFAEDSSTDTLLRHMGQFSPTAFISVPKKWMDIHRRVVGSDEAVPDAEGHGDAVRELTGGRLRWGLSAAGRLGPHVFRFFQRHGIDLLSGYGMTEATGGITMTPPGGYVEDSIGKALPAIELGFADDGELMLRGPYVTPGYTDPDENEAAFRDGWFCTGDIVAVDEDGFLRHTDRKKDIYKSSSGRTVAPQRVEALFADFPEISRVFAVGDGRDYVTLLIRPNLAYEQMDFEGMSREALHEYFRGLVVSCNRFLAPFERVVNFAVIDRDFSQEEGDLTQKGSFRRFNVVESFRELIEPMYATAWIERPVDGLRVRIPVAFLQHLGVTESDIQVVEDGIAFLGADRKLRIRLDPGVEGRVWVGNCAYEGVPHVLDLDHWLRVPKLWVGNAELSALTGEAILLWTLSADDRLVETEMVAVEPSERSLGKWPERLHATGEREPGLLDVHAAAVVLSSAGGDQASHAIRRLTRVMRLGRLQHQELAESRLQFAWSHPEIGVRGKAFISLWKHQAPPAFNDTAMMFCGSLNDFLDEEACERLAALAYTPEKWRPFGRALTALRQRVLASPETDAHDQAARLLRSLARIAVLEEDYYLPVRRQLAAWRLTPAVELVRVAGDALEEIKAAFRKRLGPRTHEAVDPGTKQPYGWSDTLRFEDGLDPADVERITSAVRETDLVREAVYLLHRRRLDLPDLAPGSIWVRIVGTWFGRTIYTAAVRPRSRDRCDFVLYVRGAGVPVEDFVTDLQLMVVGAGDPGRVPLSRQLAGYWPEHGLAATEYIPDESLQALMIHMQVHPDAELRQRVIGCWEHLAWSALTAAFRFLRRTEGRWILTGNLAKEVSVPLNDYDERTRVLSTAGWQPFEGNLDALLRLSRGFLEPVRFHFPALRNETPDDLLFAGALEALGLRDGLEFLKGALAEAGAPEEQPEEVRALCRRMRVYVTRVEEEGFMPRALRFAIARYHDWAKQVPDADVHARAAQLRELRNNYRLEAVTRRFPGSRLWFYRETVLHGAPEEGKALMRRATAELREGQPIRDVLGQLYRDMRDKLPQYDHQYFLARAAYPHLDPDEKAQLVTTAEAGTSRAELATVHYDSAGRELRIRPVADARELDALYRLFYAAGMGRALTGDERLLVTLDPAGYVVGGISYIVRTPHHVIFDKVVVLPRFRGLGIGGTLTREFIRRLEAEGVSIVSSEFIRADWLSRFGFRPHPNHAGVVLQLAPDEPNTDPEAHHDDHA